MAQGTPLDLDGDGVTDASRVGRFVYHADGTRTEEPAGITPLGWGLGLAFVALAAWSLTR